MIQATWTLRDAGDVRGAAARRAQERALADAERMLDEERLALDRLAGADVPHLHASLRRCAAACVRGALAGVAADADPESGCLPGEVDRLARLWAQMRLAPPALLRGVRRGHAALSQLWLEQLSASELGAAERDALLASSNRFLFVYADRVADALAAAYERERAELRAAPAQRRLEFVRRVLAGGDVDEDALGYRVRAEHVGVAAWGAQAEGGVRAVADVLGGRALMVRVSDELVWGWVGGARHASWHRRLENVPTLGASIAVGSPAAGPDGFRHTHEEAVAAMRVAARRPQALTFYQDVALEALAVGDEPLARVFVTRELGSLAGRDPRTVRLRRTLRVYLGACGQNAAATAAALGVHDQTVRSQLRAIERRLGRAIVERHAELAAALRLHALFAREPA